MITVQFPRQFEKVLNGQLQLEAEGHSITSVLSQLCTDRSELKKLLFHDTKNISPFLAFCILGQNKIMTSTTANEVSLKPGDVVEIFLSMAGG